MAHRQRTETKFVVFHCSASPQSSNFRAVDIKRLHTSPRTETIQWGPYTLKGKAWSDIGYGLVIPADGTIEIGRGLDAIGAHVKGYNRVSASVCLSGGISDDGTPEDNFTDAQWLAFDELVPLLQARYPGARFLGHRDLSPDANGDGVIDRRDWLKACPCFDVRERLGIT